MTPEEFVKKYGTRTVGLCIQEFIRRAPAFPHDEIIAGEIGAMIADLESMLEHISRGC